MQKTPKKNVTMGIGFKLRSISKLVLVTILNYKIVPSKYYPLVTAQEQYPTIWDLTE